MTDTFNVTGSFDANTYTVGQTMTITISGVDVVTTTNTVTTNVGPVTIPLVANDGATSTISVGPVTATSTIVVAANDSVVIDTTQPIVDASSNTRVWTVSNTGISCSATA